MTVEKGENMIAIWTDFPFNLLLWKLDEDFSWWRHVQQEFHWVMMHEMWEMAVKSTFFCSFDFPQAGSVTVWKDKYYAWTRLVGQK